VLRYSCNVTRFGCPCQVFILTGALVKESGYDE
jgi:hypothetical protein